MPFELFPWQKRELSEHAFDPKRGIFASPRLGKTLAAIETLAKWPMGRTVVFAPLMVCPQWVDELTRAGMRVIGLYSGSKASRLSRWELNPDVIVMNYDVADSFIDDLIAWKPTNLIADESHLIKGVSALRAKAVRRVAWRCKNVRLLTGTPSPNHYGDLWGQMVALDKVEWQSYAKFADRYLIRHAMFPSKVIGHRNVEELQERLLKYVTIVRREDEFGPDTWQFITRKIPLDTKSQRMYGQLAREWILKDEGVSADHILKRLIRLQQLSAGFLPTDTGDTHEVHGAKVGAVLADLEEIVEVGEKAVLFHRFTWEGETYYREIKKKYGNASVYRIYGGTPIAERHAIVEGFRRCGGAAVAVVQTQAGGIGISFASATHALFTSRDFSYTNDQQARDRIYAPGARRVVTYYECDKTVDQFIAKVLTAKKNVHDSVTNADQKEMIYGPIG